MRRDNHARKAFLRRHRLYAHPCKSHTRRLKSVEGQSAKAFGWSATTPVAAPGITALRYRAPKRLISLWARQSLMPR
jgi:hypothetical protein